MARRLTQDSLCCKERAWRGGAVEAVRLTAGQLLPTFVDQGLDPSGLEIRAPGRQYAVFC